ncbi:MAG TPA: SDR family oxidoreductase [Thermoanaerobaculia bacterium]
MKRRRLDGKTAVITGASSGVGRAIARAFADEGARVALIARNAEALEAAAREVRERGGEALVLPLDVANPGTVNEAADRAADAFGAIDIWVNDAMVSVFAPIVDTAAEEVRRVTEVNYLGYVHGTMAALRHMLPRDRGVIIQIGSALAYRSIPLQAAYCASKAAIRAFTDSLRSELWRGRSGVRVTMLQLPAVNTPQFEVVRNRLAEHPQPVPPIYQPELIARAAVRAAIRPRREMWIGWSATAAIVGQRIFPGFLDRYLARHAWEAQETRDLPPGHPTRHTRDNLDAPIPGDRGAHGPFDDRARPMSSKFWLRTHGGWLAAAALGMAAVLVWWPIRESVGR